MERTNSEQISRWASATAIVSLCAACGGAQVKQGDLRFDTIRIEGNHAIDSDTLQDGLVLDRHRDVDEYQLALDTERLSGAYQRLGYFAVDVKSRIDRKGQSASVVFTIVEGPRATTHVEIQGLPGDISAATARELVHLAEGAPFSYDAYDAAKAPMLALVENAGYAHARLDAGVIADRKNAKATVRFVFEPGPRCTFGDVVIDGITGELADAARARLTFHPGDRYSSAAVAASQVEVLGLGRFSTARIEPDRTGTASVIPVKISVIEANRHEVRLGGGFGLDPLNYSIRGRAQYSLAGWPSPMSTVNFDFKPMLTFLRDKCGLANSNCGAEPRIRLIGTLTRQDLVRPYVKGDVEGGLDFLTVEAYTTRAARVRLGLSTPILTQRVQLRVGWQLADIAFSSIDEAVSPAERTRLGLDRAELLGAYMQSLVIDLRDQPIEPRYGGYAELRIAEGTRYAGGGFQYVQVTPEVRGFLPLGPLQLAGRLRIGTISGDVPATERYFGGGASSHRGFAERHLSPFETSATDGHTVPIGGAGLIETGAELRARFGKVWGYDLGGVTFIDGGDVTETPSALSAPHLHWAVGAGIRLFLLPVGPVRFDVAYRLNRYGAGEPQPGDRLNYFISVGEAY